MSEVVSQDIRRARAAACRLSQPLAGLTALLTAGEGVRHLVAQAPEDLPLVAFSPFAALPEPPGRAPAAGLPEAARGRRGPSASGTPERTAPPATTGSPAALPSASRSASASTSASVRHPGAPSGDPQPPGPVFPLRPRVDQRPAVAIEKAGNGRAVTGPAAGGSATSRSPLHALATRFAAERAEAAGEPQGGSPVAPRPAGEGAPGRGGRDFEARAANAVLPNPDLLTTLAESALRTSRGRQASPLSPGETRPDGAEEIPGKAGAPLREAPPVLAFRAPAITEAAESIPAPPAHADLTSVPVALIREPAFSPAPSPDVDAPLDGERLADLVNEALIEQARRNGVDLS